MKTELFIKFAALAMAVAIVGAAISQLFTPAQAQQSKATGMSSSGIARVIVVGKRLSHAEKANFDVAMRTGQTQ